jgi:RNA polymerase sigma factor (sigma-70 family)
LSVIEAAATTLPSRREVVLRVSLVDKDLGLAAETEPERLDPSAFGLLYEKHRLSVYRNLRARTRSDEDALDLAATTFERAFGSLGRFRRRDGGVQAWLLRIARNCAIDAHRRDPPTVALAGADTQFRRVAVEAGRLEHQRVEILDLVARLPADQGDALLLRYAGGLTASEIGVVSGTTELRGPDGWTNLSAQVHPDTPAA